MAARKPARNVEQRVVTVSPTIELGKAIASPPVPFWRSIFTDHVGDFDMGAVLVGVVTIFMCVNAGYDTIVLHTKFDAQSFGIGVAAVLTGFAAYKFGDAKRPDVTTTTVAATTTTSAPDPNRP